MSQKLSTSFFILFVAIAVTPLTASANASKHSEPKTVRQSNLPKRKEAIPPTNRAKLSNVSTRKVTSKTGSVIKLVNVSASAYYLTNLNRVESQVGAIVIARPTQAFLSRQHYVTNRPGDAFEDNNNHIVSFRTEGQLVVESTLYSNTVTFAPNTTIRFSEPVGLVDYGTSGRVKLVIEQCYELDQNSRYVLFLAPQKDGTYEIDNVNMGHFNVDGTDPEDEIGGGFSATGSPTLKQKLREELTSRYGVQFNFLPDARIVSAANVWTVPSAWKPATQITVSIGAPRPADADLIIERQSGENPWTEIKRVKLSETTATQTEEIVVTFSGSPTDGMANVPKAADSLRVRMTNASRTSNYSTAFEMVASPEP